MILCCQFSCALLLDIKIFFILLDDLVESLDLDFKLFLLHRCLIYCPCLLLLLGIDFEMQVVDGPLQLTDFIGFILRSVLVCVCFVSATLDRRL